MVTCCLLVQNLHIFAMEHAVERHLLKMSVLMSSLTFFSSNSLFSKINPPPLFVP